ncbi:winged helix-turn-helix transcriptional regulator [Pyrobaculum aerophilum]|uniref:Winged helix-turn-helix transcriptional regulator n=1 Tax=Pyrobaculum aerophilum TaxID=13773 RepID=A0A832STW4_9CREN|nr:winged helix-turn-helix transcriptional regulator [Pyrobaculum aerophilum]HII47798.1 winged helix-turn-helix transcriptional regulator [Pyrobaculum aerophilum]
MLILLNLTAPPLLILLLPAAIVGNYSLPAPPASDVAALTPSGTPLPTWVINGTLYVLQGGDSAIAMYVPRFENASGVYTITLRGGRVVVQAPPGVMIEDISPRPERVVVNKTGLYLYLTGDVKVTYYFFTVTVTPPRPPPSPTTPPPTSPPTTATPTPSPSPPPTATPTQPQSPTVATPSASPQQGQALGTELLIAAALVAAITAVLLLRKRGRGNCADLNETDQAIIKALIDRGGVADRSDLQEALGLPKTTLHRHLHKLAKYGYIKLEQLGGRQRVELLRKC